MIRIHSHKNFLIYMYIFVFMLSACSSGGGDDENSPAIELLEGSPTATAVDVVLDKPPKTAALNVISNGVILTRLDIVLNPNASVADVNAMLKDFGGRIAASRPGSVFLTIEVPEQINHDALADLAASITNYAGIVTAIPAKEASIRLLPAFEDAVPAIVDLAIDHLSLARFPAAWNAGGLLGDCFSNPVTLFIIDKFGDLAGFGPELIATIGREFPDYTLSGSILNDGETHGWEVAAMAAASFNPSPNTGTMPFSGCLDLTLFSVAGLSYGEQIFAIEAALRNLTSPAVVNYSLGFKDRCDGNCTAATIADGSSRADFRQITTPSERAWYALSWKGLTQDMWSRFIITTASGDEINEATSELFPGLATAFYNSAMNYPVRNDIVATVQNGAWGESNTPGYDYMATTESTLEILNIISARAYAAGTPPRADNVMIVGSNNTTSEQNNSDVGEHAAANGEQRLSLSGTTRLSGSSLAAPQVAGLVAYLWALEPALRIRPMAETLRAISENLQDFSDQGGGQIIDAYATILSLDKNTASEPPIAPVREAILDVNDDGVFNQDDLTLFVNIFRLETAPNPETSIDNLSSYNRFDLNGSGYVDFIISGLARFDLDPQNSSYLGAANYGIVDLTIGMDTIKLDETKLTDLQILCYYSYSTLYLGDEATRTNLLPVDICQVKNKFAFTDYIDGNVGIFVMDEDGSNILRLTDNSANNISPAWSPSRTKIAFARNEDIFVMNADGSNQTQLTFTPPFPGKRFSRSPSWSPDGSKIVYSRITNSGQGDLYIMNADGSNQVQITNFSLTTISRDPVWSPDGSKIAFHDLKNIYVVNIDGSNLVSLTNIDPFGGVKSNTNSPAWSPDGSKIAFLGKIAPDIGLNIYTMNADGSNYFNITPNFPNSNIEPPTWSPDGSKMAFLSFGIYIANVDGTANSTLLTPINAGLNYGNLAWSQ